MLKDKISFKAKILDLEKNDIYPANILIENGVFKEIKPISNETNLDFDGIIIPGFIDSHIHIESSLLTPSSFAEAVLPFGTCSVVADPHEIANVLSVDGIQFMIDDGKEVPFDFYFMVPSSVPVTIFETSGSVVNEKDIEILLEKDEIIGLGEVMNFPGVINREPSIINKLKIAKSLNKTIDGHAPQLTGEDLKRYLYFDDFKLKDCDISNILKENCIDDYDGSNNIPLISTEHECNTFDEAIEKKSLGMKIMVREGSSAKNMEALLNLKDRLNLLSRQDFLGKISATDFESILRFPIFDFLVSDDISPEDLINGHLNLLVKKAIELGINEYEAIKMVTLNPAKHYNLNSGLIAENKIANFILVDNLKDLNVKKTFVDGKLVSENDKVLFKRKESKVINKFKLNKKTPRYFEINVNKDNFTNNQCDVHVIEVFNDELLTNNIQVKLAIENGILKENILDDILKIAIVERYGNNNVANAFVKGFGLKNSAIASSVAHDSHNIVVVGTNSHYMARAVNLIIKNKGGIVIVSDNHEKILKLPIAGIMTNKDLKTVAKEKLELDKIIKSLGCKLNSPFMSLSFLALLVIPSLKLSDKGLFDVDNFEFIDVVVNN
ncbi:MAG: amidohydrolase family protein [Methanobrevibacter sp.]|nr:amidohydrolase family protein [Methanobrevibacter sp.]